VGAIAASAALLVAAFVAYLTIAPTKDDNAHRRAFDPAQWRTPPPNDDVQWPMRLRMVDDLIASKRLDGLRRDELQRLLGPPDQTDKWKDWDLVYWLGPDRSYFRIDSEWLVVRFDRAGRVGAYRLIRD
jgi:hypothetical protein